MPATITESELTGAITQQTLTDFIKSRMDNLLGVMGITYTSGSEQAIAYSISGTNQWDTFTIEVRVATNTGVRERVCPDWNATTRTPTVEANSSRFSTAVQFNEPASVSGMEISHDQAKLLILSQNRVGYDTFYSQVLGFFQPSKAEWWNGNWPYAFVPWSNDLEKVAGCSSERSPFNVSVSSSSADYPLGLHTEHLTNENPRSLKREYYRGILLYTPSAVKCGSCGMLNEDFVMFAGGGINRGDRPQIMGESHLCIKGGASAIAVRIM